MNILAHGFKDPRAETFDPATVVINLYNERGQPEFLADLIIRTGSNPEEQNEERAINFWCIIWEIRDITTPFRMKGGVV